MRFSNATYLFQRPSRSTHNSESWWTAFFSIFLLHMAKQEPDLSLPVYTHAGGRFTKVSALPCRGATFLNTRVEARLSAEAFHLPEGSWPERFRDLRPDLTLLEAPDRPSTFIEVKTIGARIRKNFQLYQDLQAHLTDQGRPAELLYLVSSGHEGVDEWALLAQGSRLLLWEDVLREASRTPFLADLFADEDREGPISLAAYTEPVV